MKSVISKFNRIALIIVSSITLVACETGGTGGSGDHIPNPVISVIPGDSPLYVGMEVTLSAADSSDQDGDQLSYAWSQPQDQAIALTPSSADTSAASNVSVSFIASAAGTYTFILTVSDGKYEVSTEVTLDIVIDDSNEAPAFTSSSDPLSVAENSSGVIHTATASDADNDALTYSLSGSDADDFSIDASSGALSFASAPDFEAPSDADGDNVYELSLRASDGRAIVSQDLTVTVTDVNEAPSFTSSSTASAAENTSGSVYTVTASDVDASDTLSYSLVGGADLKLFALNATELSFVEAPDYESATDSDGDNVYAVQLRVTDSAGLSQDLALSITVTDVNEAPSFTSGTSTSVSENTSGTVYTATASDVDASDTQTYSLVGGADQELFALNGADLSFIAAPDYESLPASGDNTYEVQLRVTDSGDLSTDLSLSINVTDVNEAPSFTSAPASTNAAENTSGTVYTATAQDPEDVLLVFTISGTDADAFSISTTTSTQAEIAFSTPPNFEAPADSDGDNVYELTLQVTDGSTAPISQAISISVTNVNEFDASFGSEPDADSATNQIAENATAGTAVGITAAAVDGDAGTSISYAFAESSSTSAILFSIDASSGIITLRNSNSLDFESASSHELVIVAASSDGSAATHTFTVAVTDINEAPTIASTTTAVSFSEGGSGTVYDAAASDPENATLSYSLSGADANAFTISAEGLVTFNSTPDYDSAADADGNNVYAITIEVSDGTNATTQAITVTVTDLDEAPSITNTATSVSVAENSTGAVFDASATDPENTTLNYSLAGEDADALGIDSSGIISFNTTPDYDNPADADSDNVYNITIEVADATTTVTQALTISVTNINEHAASAPTDADANADQIAENATAGSAVGITAAAADADRDDSVSYSFADGSLTSGFFTIDSATGVVTLTADNSLDFESAQQHGLTIKATSSDGSSASDTFTVAVTDHDEYDVQFAAEPDADANANEIAENVSVTTAVGITAAASDQDGSNNGVSYSFANDSTTDASGLFNIDASSGVVSFNASSVLDYETDVQSYSLNIKATSADGSSAIESFSVALTNVDEAPVFASSVTAVSFDENLATDATVYNAAAYDPEGEATTYSLAGADADDLSIDSSGIITFNNSPDYDSPTDDDSNSIYQITIVASDATTTASQELGITIGNVNEAPEFAPTSAAVDAPENSATAFYTVSADDQDADSSMTYTLSGGADMDFFNLNASSGELSFKAAQDREAAANDADSDYIYAVEIAASDGSLSAPTNLTLAVTLTNVNEAPTVTNTVREVSVLEATANSTVNFAYTITGTDPEGDLLTFTLGGNDASAFDINSGTGAIGFKAGSSPDYDTPADANGDNVYELALQAQDSSGDTSDPVSLQITIIDVSSAPTFLDSAGNSLATTIGGSDFADSLELTENATGVVYTVVSVDDDGVADFSGYSVTGGADAAAFSVGSSSGELSFNTTPDYELPHDDDSDNIYVVQVTAADTDESTMIELSITVTNLNDSAPTIAAQSLSVNEDAADSSEVGTVEVSDADDPATTYQNWQITGGNTNSAFAIDADGLITVADTSQIDFETIATSYALTVEVSDGDNTGSGTVTININDINDEAPFVASASYDLAENASADDPIDTLSATDPDTGLTTTYSAWTITSGNTDGIFALNPDTGDLTVADTTNLDYDTGAQSYDLSVTVSDGANTSAAETITVTLTDVNDNAPVITANQAFSTSEASPNTTVVGTVLATDPDGDGSGTTFQDWSITGGTGSTAFAINPSSGVLTVANASELDYANGPTSYTLNLTVRDTGGANISAEQSITITIEENILPTDFTATGGLGLVTLQWSEAADTLYDIYRSSDASCDVSVFNSSACTDGQLYNSATSGMEDTGLATEATYHYWLQATRTNPAPTITQHTITPVSATTDGMGVLNDTGMYYAANTSDNASTCSSTEITYPQDCHAGRDDTNNSNSDGNYGFSFTRLQANGDEYTGSGTYSSDPWSCVLDNVTGLIWEVKTDDGTVYDKDNSYTWGGIGAMGRDSNSINKGIYYDSDYFAANNLADSSWDILVNTANGDSLCGYSDWRIPTIHELLSIVDFSYPGTDDANINIDKSFFPNTYNNRYWSSIPDSYSNTRARIISFSTFEFFNSSRNSGRRVRLVRSE